MPSKHYDVFKHRVRQKMPKRIRYATVCRRCKKATTQSDRCLTCQIDFATWWGRAY